MVGGCSQIFVEMIWLRRTHNAPHRAPEWRAVADNKRNRNDACDDIALMIHLVHQHVRKGEHNN
jgi:hypothetical protein